MTRQEFMTHLEKLLWDISENEREEALQYYNDYFDDAGAENEEAVLKELGSPLQVAKKIKAGFQESAAEYSEQGYEDTRFRDAMEMIVEEEKQNWTQTERMLYEEEAAKGQKRKTTANKWNIVEIILLCLFGLPIVLPLGIGLLATIFGIVIAIIAIIFGLALAGIAILFSGLIFFGVGIAKLMITPAIGLALTGVGCILVAIGLLATVFLFWCAAKFIPWVIRGIVSLIQRIFRKAGARG